MDAKPIRFASSGVSKSKISSFIAPVCSIDIQDWKIRNNWMLSLISGSEEFFNNNFVIKSTLLEHSQVADFNVTKYDGLTIVFQPGLFYCGKVNVIVILVIYNLLSLRDILDECTLVFIITHNSD